MDLRVKKTKRAIQNAFYELLREKPAEKITVTEIATRAEINKTTFYAHYETLDALVAELEQQTIQHVVEHMSGAYQLLEQPEAFVRNLFEMMRQTADFLVRFPFLPPVILRSVCNSLCRNSFGSRILILRNMRISVPC